MISPDWLIVEIKKIKIKISKVVSRSLKELNVELKYALKITIDNKYPPITPEMVFFGLMLVNFGPFKILPKMYPPKSVEIQIPAQEQWLWI